MFVVIGYDDNHNLWLFFILWLFFTFFPSTSLLLMVSLPLSVKYSMSVNLLNVKLFCAYSKSCPFCWVSPEAKTSDDRTASYTVLFSASHRRPDTANHTHSSISFCPQLLEETKEGRFGLHIRKNFFNVRVVGHWNWLPQRSCGCPTPESIQGQVEWDPG